MQQQNTFVGWDFNTIWTMREDSYPVFNWQEFFNLSIINGSGSGMYYTGSKVSLTANTPLEGYMFTNWTTSGGGTFANANSAATTFTMPANATTVTANYSLIPTYAHTVTNGSGDGSYTANAQVPISANSPADGYIFTNWTSSSGGTFANANSASTTFNMPANATTVTANYQLKTYTVTFNLVDGSLDGSSAPLIQNIQHGQAATAPTVIPPQYFNFTGWNATFNNITSDITVTAQYESSLPGQKVARYRVYNPNDGHHHYTTNFAEYDFLGSVGWNLEGISCYIYDSQAMVDSVLSKVYYRTYNPNSGEHFWTMSEGEYNFLGSVGWNLEGTDGHLFDETVTSSLPLYRLYNTNSGYHHWTMDANERNFLVSIGWNDEGIAGYVFASAD